MLRNSEEVIHTFCDNFTHIRHRQKFIHACSSDFVNVAEMLRNFLGRRLADIPDAQSEKHVVEADFQTVAQAVQESLC